MTVVALAGRRIDAEGASSPRFALSQVAAVGQRLAALFAAESVSVLVCSAACGADLVALEAALAMGGIDCIVVLPFPRSRFRETSVTDRPGSWGAVFDRVITQVERRGGLVVLEAGAEPGTGNDSNDERYRLANEEIVRRAAALGGVRLAVIVWEGGRREEVDATEHFRRLAEVAGFRVIPVLTGTA